MSQSTEASWAPTLDEATLRGRVKQWREDDKRRADVLLLRARPSWAGAETLSVGNEQVRVVNGVSQLAVLDAYHGHPSQPTVVLTDLDDQQLGSAVRLRAERHTVQSVDAWELVPGLFKVSDPDIDRSVRALGQWVPPLLLTHQRAAGWPTATSGTLSGEHVIRSILADIIGVDGVDEVDLVALLDHLDDSQSSSRLRDYDDKELAGIMEGTKRHLGGAAALVLRAKVRATTYSALAVALVTDLLWNRKAVDAVRVRMEERFFGDSLPLLDAKQLGEAARAVILRREAAGDAHLDDVLRQAEAIFDDLGWPEGAATSTILPAGLDRRFAVFAESVAAAAESSTAERAVAADRALAEIRSHLLATHVPDEVLAAEMATRLARWLATPPTALPASIDAAVSQYWHGSSWADRARSVIWNGSSRPALARAYSALAEQVTARRETEDAAAAAVLTGDVPNEVIPIESLLSRVIEPLAGARVLLIVLDGMSGGVASELADEARKLRWVELLPDGATNRLTAIAVLPSVTRYSRSSLFAGRLTDGNQGTEKSAFAKLGGQLFHKDELRSPAGSLLPTVVEMNIADNGRKIVGVVLNTIDDALAKSDPDATRWTLNQVANLAALLGAAAAADRTVILTSDHGHVVERGGEYRADGSGGSRWRSTGDQAADEVLVSGPRVLAPGGSAVLARAEGLRYTAKAAGYHGGASLAELTVPVVVLRPPGAKTPKGWQDAPPQAPEWWYETAPEGAVVHEIATGMAVRPSKRVHPRTSAAPMFQAVVDEPARSATTEPTRLSASLLASELYAAQQQKLGRRPLPKDLVVPIIDAADDRGGRIHRDLLASVLGIAPGALEGKLTALRRLLNVDGFEAVSTDADGVTVVVDRQLLREQFDLS